jgi:hypothetical protein
VVKANFLYFTNDRNITSISKIMGCGAQIVARYLFKSKSEYEKITDSWILNKLSDEDRMLKIDPQETV